MWIFMAVSTSLARAAAAGTDPAVAGPPFVIQDIASLAVASVHAVEAGSGARVAKIDPDAGPNPRRNSRERSRSRPRARRVCKVRTGHPNWWAACT